MSLCFPFEMNIAKLQTGGSFNTSIHRHRPPGEEAPAEQDWVLVRALEELWHQKHGHLWLK